MKKPYSFKLEQELISALQEEAKQDNRNFNNYVENLLLTHPMRTKELLQNWKLSFGNKEPIK